MKRTLVIPGTAAASAYAFAALVIAVTSGTLACGDGGTDRRYLAEATEMAPLTPTRDLDLADSDEVVANARTLIERGRKIFRFDTFGSEAFFGGKLRLHEAIAGRANGGSGPGLSPA